MADIWRLPPVSWSRVPVNYFMHCMVGSSCMEFLFQHTV